MVANRLGSYFCYSFFLQKNQMYRFMLAYCKTEIYTPLYWEQAPNISLSFLTPSYGSTIEMTMMVELMIAS